MPIFIPYRWRWLTGFNVLRGADERFQDAYLFYITSMTKSLQILASKLIELAYSIVEAAKAFDEFGQAYREVDDAP